MSKKKKGLKIKKTDVVLLTPTKTNNKKTFKGNKSSKWDKGVPLIEFHLRKAQEKTRERVKNSQSLKNG